MPRIGWIRFRSAPLFVLPLAVAALACREDAESPTGPDQPTPALATAAAQALSFRQVSAGGDHTCGLTAGNVAYCWGTNDVGQLGDGTTTNRLTPVAVVGGLRFRQLSTGGAHTCGVSLGNVAYCWGGNGIGNGEGRLGDGTTIDRSTPVAVAGGLRFSQVSAGAVHTCGVSTGHVAYCWGGNDWGTLGDGTRNNGLTPVAVAGGLRFRQVAAGASLLHTCGVSADNRAYCWGAGALGLLGDGTRTDHLTPSAVAGGLRFREVSVGADQSCGVTPGHRAYCWGFNSGGQLGDGTTAERLSPVAVAGGLRFSQLSAGSSWTCGVTAGNQAYCWGANYFGEVGDGTTTERLTPVAVAGSLRFGQVSGGSYHTCGVTANNRAYCWGLNTNGKLGDGTTVAQRLTPVAVAAPAP